VALNVIKRNDKEYLYFIASASKKIYLGTADSLKVEHVREAIRLMEDRIEQYANELKRLQSLLSANELKTFQTSLTKKNEESKEKPFYYEMIFFDLDGVIYQKPWYETDDEKTSVSTWDVLFKSLGPAMYEMHEQLKQNFIKGIFKNYRVWTENACNVLKSYGLRRDKFEDIISQRPLTRGAKELFQEFKKNNIITILITGSFEALAQRAKKELGNVTYILAHCKLNFDSRGLLTSWNLEPTDYEDKATSVKKIADKHNIPLEKCAYVGDDVNDTEAFKKVGLAIAFNCKKYKIHEFADVVIESQDLRTIIPHLKVKRKSKVL
jgi:phosphoserine phosphatase